MIVRVERVARGTVFLFLMSSCKLAELPCELVWQLICDTQVIRYLLLHDCKVH